MANNKMLIDASHPEETRVVVLRGNRIEEFDFESASKKPLRGNIYLAKVTRVEPSLQAAFIEYGGNRHGFLAFPEIHPDYYQIPVADRQALLEEEARERSEEESEQEERRPQRRNQRRRRPDDRARRRHNGDAVLTSPDATEGGIEDEANAGLQSDALTQDAQPQEIPAEGQEVFGEVFGQEGSGQEIPAREARDRGDEARPADGDAIPAIQAEIAPPAPAIEAQSAGHWGEQDSAPQESRPQDPVPEFQSQAAEPAEARYDESMSVGELEARAIPGHDPDQDAGEEPAADEDSQNDSDEDSDGDDSGEDDSGEDDSGEDDEEIVEQLGGDAEEEMPRAVRRSRRQYKIQEVIKRRQVMLVQVVKEERGNKGAALTTYLSLAGRYSVLMPNTARGGGISRKITDGEDRRRLKEIVQELDVPDGMGVILRTAGASRPMDDVRRDFEYLLRMWESVRELTLRSTAPTLVYEEGSLIKRSIRDLYGKDVDEVIVSGDGGYAEARDYMRMLLPNQVKNVRHWREPQPLFAKSGVETQLDSMFTNVVTLRSGGYIVINQTEALVAIDVNSGRSTREHNIEDTALRTNMEAADEVARQLRLRDLAGLIVVDFIDMDEHRNNRAVERRMKDALKSDRARIQVGRISHFGLLEMSRQRMRPGVLEGSSVVCPHCMGAGTVRSTASIALHVLRLVEDSLVRTNAYNLIVRTRAAVALYILNQKRAHVYDLEQRFGVSLFVEADETLTGSVYHAIERGEAATAPAAISAKSQQIRIDSISPWQDDESEDEEATNGAIAPPAVIERDDDMIGDDDDAGGASAGPDDDGDQRRKRRRRRRRGREREESTIDPAAPQPSDDGLAIVASLTRDIPQVSEDASAMTASGEESELVGGESDDERGARRGRRRRRPRRGERDLDSGEASGEAEVTAEGMSNQAKEAPQDSELAPTAPTQSGEPAVIAPVEPSYQNGGWTFTPSAPAPVVEPSMTTQAEAPQPATGMQEAPALELQPSEPALREPAAQEPSALETKQAQKDQARQDETERAETARRAALEMLPEAPAPEQKKTGWWARMRNAGN